MFLAQNINLMRCVNLKNTFAALSYRVVDRILYDPIILCVAMRQSSPIYCCWAPKYSIKVFISKNLPHCPSPPSNGCSPVKWLFCFQRNSSNTIIFLKKVSLEEMTRHCHSFLLVISWCYFFSFVVALCKTHCQSLYHYLSLAVARCNLLPFAVLCIVTQCMTRLPCYIRFNSEGNVFFGKFFFLTLKSSNFKGHYAVAMKI